MSKELKALKHLYDTAKDEWNIGTATRTLLDENYNDLVKYLTPPTADEVCKALSELYQADIIYDNGNFVFRTGSSLIVSFDSGILFRCDTLPPHLITLIGRFYTGRESK